MTRLAPYLSQHQDANLKGPGDGRPTAVQIIQDQGLVGAWPGRVVLITGCSPGGGLGPETAKAMHLTGADVYVTSRDATKGQQVVDEILAFRPSSDGDDVAVNRSKGIVGFVVMDLCSLSSVRAGAQDFLRRSGGKLNILINNAGVMFCPEGRTEEGGFETHIAANHLGHFYLFHLVEDALIASSAAAEQQKKQPGSAAAAASRVVQLASGAHRYGKINLSDLHFVKVEYDPHAAYGQAKLANVLFANELDRRYRDRGVRALSVHPGGILTPLTRHMGEDSIPAIDTASHFGRMMKNAAQGAATTVWGAVARELEGKGGIYLDEVAEAELVGPEHPYYMGGYAMQAFDPPTEKALWEESARLTGAKAE